MDKSQIKFGDVTVRRFVEKWSVDEATVITILKDLNSIQDFYKWINADKYLYERK